MTRCENITEAGGRKKSRGRGGDMRVRFEDMHYALVLRIFQRNSATALQRYSATAQQLIVLRSGTSY